MPVRVGVNGFGTIGKRVADAIMKQNDMELVGVVKRKPDYEALAAISSGYPLYASDPESLRIMEEAGLKPSGTLADLLEKADVVVDATPGGVGASYKELYEEYGVKTVFQGGEKAEVAEISFSTLCNYEDAIGRKSLRVVSCNTTGLLRLLCTLREEFNVKKATAFIVRRGADPKEVKRGPLNSIVLNPAKIPSHHGIDAMKVIAFPVITAAVAVPTTLMHLHYVNIELESNVGRSSVLSVLESAPRIIVLSAEKTGIVSTSQIIEFFRDMGRKRGDVPELVVWEDSVYVDGNTISIVQAVHQESIVIPENIDAVRALAQMDLDKSSAVEKTDQSLGLLKSLEERR